MSKTDFNSLRLAALSSPVALLVIALTAASSQSPSDAPPQNKSEDRTVSKLWKSPMPVEVRAVKTKRKSTDIGRAVADGDDWFEGLTVSVTNVSGKTIIYLGGGFLFPRQQQAADAGPPKYQRFAYGQHPEAPDAARLRGLPLSLRPGEALDISLRKSDYDSVKQRLKQLGYSDSIKEIKLNVEEVHFDDGTVWAAGQTFERAPLDQQSRGSAAAHAVKKKRLRS